jgi:hypothetical protein
LNVLGDAADLGAIADAGGRDMKSERMAERIDDQMQLRALLALGPVIAGAPAAPTSSTVAAWTQRSSPNWSGRRSADGRKKGTHLLPFLWSAPGLEAQLPVGQPSILAMIKGQCPLVLPFLADEVRRRDGHVDLPVMRRSISDG